MKKILIALLLSIAFVSCSKEDISESCGLNCDITVSNGDPNCGRIEGGALIGEGCEFGYIIVKFNGSIYRETICLKENAPNLSNYNIGEIYCKD